MSLALLIPLSLAMGLAGVGAFIWAMRHDQFEDLDGAAWRVLLPGETGEEDGDALIRGATPPPDRTNTRAPDERADRTA